MPHIKPDMAAYFILTWVLGISRKDNIKATHDNTNGAQSSRKEATGENTDCPNTVLKAVFIKILIPAEHTIITGTNRHIDV